MTPGAFWIENWPIKRTSIETFFLGPNHTLSCNQPQMMSDKLKYIPDAGIALGNWWGDITGDLQHEDQVCLTYDSPVVSKEQYLIGMPIVQLRVSVDVPMAHWIVRLEDVHPNGTVSFITGGLKNGAQRFSRTQPQAIIPGEEFMLEIPLRFTTWTFKEGHRIRLAISNAQFPMIWPTPYPMSTTIFSGMLTIPFVPKNALPSSELPPPEPREVPHDFERYHCELVQPFRVVRDEKHKTTTTSTKESWNWRIKDRHYASKFIVSYSVNTEDPAQAAFCGQGEYTVAMQGRKIEIYSTTHVTSDIKEFHVTVTRKIFQNGDLLKTRTWEKSIPRDFQ
jgi:hypothetical protein